MTRDATGRYKVSGPLVFDTAREVLRQAGIDFQSAAEVSIDLSGVSTADSAGLALLIEWYCNAERAKRSIRFINAPAQLRALAKISEIETILPFG